MLSHNELKKGVRFLLDGQPYEVLDYSLSFKGRGSSTAQTKVKNLVTGSIVPKSFHPGDQLEEIEIEKVRVKFVYEHKGKFVFSKENDPSNRFELAEEVIGSAVRFLKPNEIIEGIEYERKVINVSLPIKVQLKVVEAPPGVKGDRAQGGNKIVKVETGAEINAPIFVEEGDIIEINTETGGYTRRVE